MSSLPIFSTPGSLPHKGVSSQPCNIVPHIWISHCFTLINLFHRHPKNDLRLATSRRCITIITAWLSAVACSLATVIVHIVLYMPQAVPDPCPQAAVDPTVDPNIVQVSILSLQSAAPPFRPSEGPLGRSLTTIDLYILCYHSLEPRWFGGGQPTSTRG